MKDIIAALQSLVLPWDATTGTRIVLDGVNGKIQVYNALNQLEAEIVPGGVITVWNNSISPPAYVQLQGSHMYVVSGDDSHYVDVSAGPAIASVQVVENSTDTNVLLSVDTNGVPYSRWEHRVGAVVNYMQVSCDAATGKISYQPNFADFSLDQHFVEGAGIRWYCADPALGNTRGFFYDQAAGFIKSQARNGGTGAFTTENWINAALAGTFTALAETPQYKLLPDGMVKLQGGVHSTAGVPAGGTVVFTLPAGYRPASTRLYAAAQWGTAVMARLLVTSAGQVQIYDATVTDFPLDVVSFSTI